MKSPLIKTERQRAALPKRTSPYWNCVSPRKAIGFRKYAEGGIWVVRHNGIILTLKGSERLDYDSALSLVLAHCREADMPSYTVQKAIDDYAKAQRASRGISSEVGARKRLESKLPEEIRDMEMKDLSLSILEEWRDGLVSGEGDGQRKSRSTCNRVLAMAKACFNKAYKTKRVSSNEAWKDLSLFSDTDSFRTLFLTKEQTTALLVNSDGAIHNLIQGCILTGMRMGEARECTVDDVDLKMNTLRLDGKTGVRVCQMSESLRSHVQTMIEGKASHEPVWAADDGFKWKPGKHSVPFARTARNAGSPSGTVLYSLRHFHISQCVKAGVPTVAIARQCGCAASTIEKVYAHFRPSDIKEMMDGVDLLDADISENTNKNSTDGSITALTD